MAALPPPDARRHPPGPVLGQRADRSSPEASGALECSCQNEPGGGNGLVAAGQRPSAASAFRGLAVLRDLGIGPGMLRTRVVEGRPLRPVAAVPATARRVSEGALTERTSLQGPADELREIDSPSGSSRWPKAIGDWSNVAGPTWPGSPAWSWSRPRPTAPCSTLTWRRAPFSVTLSCSSEAVANLLENAVRYNIPGGRISIRTGSDGDLSWIQVANSPIPDLKGDPDELFLPFRRSGSARGHQGFGLGLSIVRSVALAHGGLAAIEVENGQFHVRMRLPRDGH